MNNRYIHYGAKEYDASKFSEIINQPMTKPLGGLWASPVECDFGWKEFAENAIGLESVNLVDFFEFELAEGANVLKIHSGKDLEKLPQLPDSMFLFKSPGWIYLDFEKLRNRGVDVIEYKWTAELYRMLYTWDCDSILVMNQNVIKPI